MAYSDQVGREFATCVGSSADFYRLQWGQANGCTGGGANINTPNNGLMNLDLTGKKLVVIGGTTGLGWSAAKAFVEAGAQVVLCDDSCAAIQGNASAMVNVSVGCTILP